MKRENRVVQLSGWGLSLVMVLVMMVTSIAGQDAGRKKFLKKPLVIEDQGSFFIGGVPKVTNYATLPAPNNPNPRAQPNHDRPDVRAISDTGQQEVEGPACNHGAWIDTYGGLPGIHSGWTRRLGSVFCA